MTISEFLARFDSKVATAGQWKVQCPAHDDRQASLAVREGDDGRILLKCHAQCDVASILAAMSLTSQDLFNGTRRRGRREVAAYTYTDETGATLFQGVRFEPKGFAQRRPDGAGGWIWNLQGTRRVIYRLREIHGKKRSLSSRARRTSTTCERSGFQLHVMWAVPVNGATTTLSNSSRQA